MSHRNSDTWNTAKHKVIVQQLCHINELLARPPWCVIWNRALGSGKVSKTEESDCQSSSGTGLLRGWVRGCCEKVRRSATGLVVQGDPRKALGSSGWWMNERVILETSSRLYKAVEREFNLPTRQEVSLPVCLPGLDTYLSLDKWGALLNHHSMVRQTSAPLFSSSFEIIYLRCWCGRGTPFQATHVTLLLSAPVCHLHRRPRPWCPAAVIIVNGNGHSSSSRSSMAVRNKDKLM